MHRRPARFGDRSAQPPKRGRSTAPSAAGSGTERPARVPGMRESLASCRGATPIRAPLPPPRSGELVFPFRVLFQGRSHARRGAFIFRAWNSAHQLFAQMEGLRECERDAVGPLGHLSCRFAEDTSRNSARREREERRRGAWSVLPFNAICVVPRPHRRQVGVRFPRLDDGDALCISRCCAHRGCHQEVGARGLSPTLRRPR